MHGWYFTRPCAIISVVGTNPTSVLKMYSVFNVLNYEQCLHIYTGVYKRKLHYCP